MKNKCTCGSTTSQHSIFCSGSFYNDSFKDVTYTPKSNKDAVCKICQLIKPRAQFKNLSKVCQDCV